MKRVWILAVAAGWLLGMAGCSKKEEGTATPSMKEKIEAKVGAAAPVVELARAWANMHEAKSWRQRMTMEGGKGETLLEVSCPDKEHMTSSMGRQSFESVHIGNDSWARIGGTWTKMPATHAGMGIGMCPGAQSASGGASGGGMGSSGGSGGSSGKGVSDVFDQLKKASITVGSLQTVEGNTCQEYIVTLAADPAAGRDKDMTTNVCVGVSDHMPYRMLMDRMTMTWWDWNKQIDIHPPM
ncbi:MAG TPA: hypothetical protein VLT85_00480 [Terriglobales bacterium]|nr:hypothetical protein [Terriglobales bacterium]